MEPVTVGPNKQARACGPCASCCTAIPIDEFDKPAGVPCTHLIEGMCSIYATRPEVCRKFYCLWSYGRLEGSARPDRTGVVAYAVAEPDGAPVLHVREVEAGAFDRTPGRVSLKVLQRESPVRVVAWKAKG